MSGLVIQSLYEYDPSKVRISDVWRELPDESLRRPGTTCEASRTCLSIGEKSAHSHYAWAKDRFWAAFGDFQNGERK